jgi:prepilin-type N-terminal cleavage/methylation domain-containing protein
MYPTKINKPLGEWLCPRRGQGRPGPLGVRHSPFTIHHFPSGVTLIEMMIVLFIISMLAVAALRALPGEDQRVREAARMVDGYLGAARHRAMEIGRPVGVIFKRFANRPDACTTLQQCEVPPSYAGEETNAVVKVQNWTFRPDNFTYRMDGLIVLKLYLRANSSGGAVTVRDFSNNLLRRGDLVQLNGQGPYFKIGYDDPSMRRMPVANNMNPPTAPVLYDIPEDPKGYLDFTVASRPSGDPPLKDDNYDNWVDNYVLTLFLDSYTVQTLPWPEFRYGGVSNAVAFNVLRQPGGESFATKSAASPLQLPANTAVDLAFSGMGSAVNGIYFARRMRGTSAELMDTTSSVMVIYSSTGAVDCVYCYQGSAYGARPATGPIYLLVGRFDRVPILLPDPNANRKPQVDHFEALPQIPAEEQYPNWADPKNMWLVIQPQTGFISATEMFPIDRAGIDWTRTDPILWPGPPSQVYIPSWPYVPGPWYPSTPPKDDGKDWQTAIELSRTFAREAQAVGGR